jgi:hypothetical protein
MKWPWYLSAALATLLALSVLEAQAGRKGITLNGPALDGRQVALPEGASVDGASETRFEQCPPWTCGQNGPALDGRRVATPHLVRLQR